MLRDCGIFWVSSLILLHRILNVTIAQRAHNFETTLIQRLDVVSTSCAGWEVLTLFKSVELFGSCRGVLRSSQSV